MNNTYDPRDNRPLDDSEAMLLAEALYIYERNLEGEDDLEDSE